MYTVPFVHLVCGTCHSLSLAVVLGALACAHATVYDLQPGTLSSPGSLSPILNALPGDTFILHATATNRVYGRVYTATAWSGKGGSAAGGWVTIKGADGEPRPLITYSGGNNVFDSLASSTCSFRTSR